MTGETLANYRSFLKLIDGHKWCCYSRNCAARVLSPAKRVRVIELVAGLEEMPDVSPLMNVLTGK